MNHVDHSTLQSIGLLKSGLRAVATVACLLLAFMGAGIAQTAPEAPVLVPSADGSDVHNLRAGVAWSRCLEGQQWTGRSCAGAPRLLEYTQALAAASARRNADGKPWRLPRAPELQRLAGQLAHLPPAQANTLLPDSDAAAWLWSSSTTVDNSRVNAYEYGNIRRGVTNENLARVSFLHGWAVDLRNGQADGHVAKRTALPVRLVRTLDP